VGLAALAGCANRSSDGATGSSEPSVSETAGGPFAGVSFDGGELVVALAPGHGLSGANLIAPDGTIFEQAAVATGVRTVRITILDPQPDDGGYRHYTPGVHELVGVDAEGGAVGSISVPMQPEIAITGIEQYRSGDQPSDLGSLVVTVENTGTAPTWVYDITYRDAPNFAANVDLRDNPGVALVRTLPGDAPLLCAPDTVRTYVDVTPPLAIPDDGGISCTGESAFSIILGLATRQTLEGRIEASLSGEATEVGLTSRYVCSRVEIDWAEVGIAQSRESLQRRRNGDSF
jgi:hypothetical protein